LIDGGFVNPLPFDLLRPQTNFVIAVDVSGGPIEARTEAPRAVEALLGAQQIALRSIINAKIKSGGPDILIRPAVGQFRVLDFRRMDEILAAARDAKESATFALQDAQARAHLRRMPSS
jgi:NTE family protein